MEKEKETLFDVETDVEVKEVEIVDEVIIDDVELEDKTTPTNEVDIIDEAPVVLLSVGKINTEGADRLLKVIKRQIAELDLENKVVNADTVQEIKKIRAGLNKDLASIKADVKVVKDEFNKPLVILDEKVKLIYAELDKAYADLKTEIDKYEDGLKLEKENDLRTFFAEVKTLTNQRLADINENVNFVEFEDVGLNITLSATKVSLEKQVSDHFEKRYNDMLVVNSHANADRLRVKYIQLKELGKAQIEVQNDIKLEAQVAETRPEPKVVEPTPAPIVEDVPVVEEIINMTFKVSGTRTQLIAVREFMKVNGIKYE